MGGIVNKQKGECYLRIKTGLFLRDLRIKTGLPGSLYGKVENYIFIEEK
jgi:hypothetical protein